MAKIIIRHDIEGNSLDIWFGEPSEIFESEEVEDGLILKKNKAGETIGIEKLNWLPIGSWKVGEPVEIDTGVPLREAQEAVGKASQEHDKEMVYSSAFFIALLNGQLGSVAKRYLDEGRRARGVEIDIADIIVCGLAYLNWLGKDASEAFLESLEKHRAKLAELWKTPRTSLPVAKVHVGIDEIIERPGISPKSIEEGWQEFQRSLGIKTP